MAEAIQRVDVEAAESPAQAALQLVGAFARMTRDAEGAAPAEADQRSLTWLARMDEKARERAYKMEEAGDPESDQAMEDVRMLGEYRQELENHRLKMRAERAENAAAPEPAAEPPKSAEKPPRKAKSASKPDKSTETPPASKSDEPPAQAPASAEPDKSAKPSPASKKRKAPPPGIVKKGKSVVLKSGHMFPAPTDPVLEAIGRMNFADVGAASPKGISYSDEANLMMMLTAWGVAVNCVNKRWRR